MEMESPADGNADDDHGEEDQSESTASSFHNINFDNDDDTSVNEENHASTDSTSPEDMPPLVPRTYPGHSNSENEPDNDTDDDDTIDDDNYSYYGEPYETTHDDEVMTTPEIQTRSLTDAVQNLSRQQHCSDDTWSVDILSNLTYIQIYHAHEFLSTASSVNVFLKVAGLPAFHKSTIAEITWEAYQLSTDPPSTELFPTMRMAVHL